MKKDGNGALEGFTCGDCIGSDYCLWNALANRSYHSDGRYDRPSVRDFEQDFEERKLSFLRFRMDLAIKEPIPDELKTNLDDIKESMLRLQKFSEKINAGRPNEENSTMLEEHTCNHDVGKRCEQAHELKVSVKKSEENKNNDTMGELCSLAWIPYTKWGLARHK